MYYAMFQTFVLPPIVSEAISRIVPSLSCDIGALMVEAQIIENRMKNVRAEQKRISYIA